MHFSEILILLCVIQQMKMHPETWKVCTVVYRLVILLCCMIRVNGDTDTYIDSSPPPHIDSNSDILKILMGVQNERGAETSNSMLSMKINAGTINFNVPLTVFDSEPNKPEYKTAINNVRKDDYTVTEGIDFQKLHDRPIKPIRDDYTWIEGHGYYKLHKTELNWNEARKACIAENAHLAVINSLKEESALRQLMRMFAPAENQAYIGAHDIFEEGDWVTDTGEALEDIGYNKWADGEPNDEHGNEDCAVLHQHCGINDVPCSFKYYYICEIPL